MIFIVSTFVILSTCIVVFQRLLFCQLGSYGSGQQIEETGYLSIRQCRENQRLPTQAIANTTQARITNSDLYLEFAGALKQMTGKFNIPELRDFYDTPGEIEKTKSNVVETYSDQDPFQVNWNGTDDPENPMNFSPQWMWINVALVSTIAFVA